MTNKNVVNTSNPLRDIELRINKIVSIQNENITSFLRKCNIHRTSFDNILKHGSTTVSTLHKLSIGSQVPMLYFFDAEYINSQIKTFRYRDILSEMNDVYNEGIEPNPQIDVLLERIKSLQKEVEHLNNLLKTKDQLIKLLEK